MKTGENDRCFICSVCGAENVLVSDRFCYLCGTPMPEPSDSEEE